ncbi:CCA tRNA nucleotidyltransferase [Prochlorothrix hollandica]|uniref:CCA tRNA nucleotidyltransferase n=1 Tax=Prochlorothrix hollandica TaxID=1223 RepID=UPI00333FAADB
MHLSPAPTSPLNPQSWPFDLKHLPLNAHLVGGSVRDALLQRQGDYLDLDVVVPSAAVETAQALARCYRAGFVVLDAKRHIARVVFDRATVDVALQEGSTLEADLGRRDFTVNAIAYNPHSQTLIDPLNGYRDLEAQQLRMISAANLEADPLRLLRAYRQAAQLQFSIDPATAATIAHLAPHLGRIAAERIQSELNALLHHPQGTPWIEAAWQVGLFQTWLPSLDALAMAHLLKLDHGAQGLMERWPALAASFQQPIPLTRKESSPRTGLALAKLTTLLATEDDRAEKEWQTLKGSRAEIRAVGLLRRLQPQLRLQPLSIRQQYLLFQSAQGLLPVLALLGLTEPGQPCFCGPGSQGGADRSAGILGLVERFLDPTDPVAHLKPLVTGQALVQTLDLKPGPHIGHLLTELQVAQAEGRIDSPAAALALARSWQ